MTSNLAGANSSTIVPDLEHDQRSFFVNSVNDPLPSLGLFFSEDTTRTRETIGKGRNLAALSQDKTETSSLGVVFNHEVIGNHIRLVSSHSGEGSNNEFVLKLESTELGFLEEN